MMECDKAAVSSQAGTEALLSRHEAAVAAQQSAGQLPAAMLSQLLKSCLSMEVDASALADRLHPLLAAQRWSERAHAALNPWQPSACLTGAPPCPSPPAPLHAPLLPWLSTRFTLDA